MNLSRFGILIYGVGFCSLSFSGVYHCVGESGAVEFRDTPCRSNTEKESFLPYTYQKTNPKIVESQEKEIQEIQKKIKSQQKREIKNQNQLRKQAEKDALKAKRREARCLRVQENIKEIETQLRLGCKLHKANRLRAKLNHFELMKKRYCGVCSVS